MSWKHTALSLPARLALSCLGLAAGAGLAYGWAFEFPHLAMRLLEVRRDAAILAIQRIEPGLEFTRGGTHYRFDPGLNPSLYGADAGRICGQEGSLFKLEMFGATGHLDQGYDSCAEMMLVKRAAETGDRRKNLSQIVRATYPEEVLR